MNRPEGLTVIHAPGKLDSFACSAAAFVDSREESLILVFGERGFLSCCLMRCETGHGSTESY